MAFSVTMLAWGVIEYWDVYKSIGELQNALEALKWGSDYFLKAHISAYELYGQVKEHLIKACLLFVYVFYRMQSEVKRRKATRCCAELLYFRLQSIKNTKMYQYTQTTNSKIKRRC